VRLLEELVGMEGLCGLVTAPGLLRTAVTLKVVVVGFVGDESPGGYIMCY
jgi:hypothetical protein